MRLSKPFIRLPFRFDAEQLAVEARQFAAERWMPHPSGLVGNAAIALISSGGGDNDSFAGEKRETPHLARCPYTRQAMASFGEVLSRSRFMRLNAGCEVGRHVDFNYHWHSRVRIHIPVVTEPDVIFECGASRLHMEAGECWIFDSWRWHRVVHGGARDRIHLVLDTCGSSRFWECVRAVQDLDPATVANTAQRVPFEPSRQPALRLERFSASPVMAPGECEALIEDLIADFSANRSNDPRLVAAYVALLRGFAHDWRELWLLHGEQADGRTRYRALIEDTRRQLHPNRRALTTSSNGIGVNAVFVQRVLSAALGDGGSR